MRLGCVFSEVRRFSKVTSVSIQGFFGGACLCLPGRPFAMKVTALGIPHGEGGAISNRAGGWGVTGAGSSSRPRV